MMIGKPINVAIFISLLVPAIGGAQSTASTDASTMDRGLFFVLGNIEYVLLHELAHVLIGDLDIPIIGPEENAADYIATATLIRADLFDAPRAARAREFLLATANGLATSWDFFVGAGQEVPYWDSHSLTIQRFYQMICLIYGSNPEEFAQLPGRVGMPEHRAARCPREFERADRSLQWLLENYGRKPGDPDGARIEVEYERAPTQASQRVASELRASGIIDNTIRRLHERFTIREPFRITFRRCDQPQAAWIPLDRRVVICYELLDNYYTLGRTRSATNRQTILDEPG